MWREAGVFALTKAIAQTTIRDPQRLEVCPAERRRTAFVHVHVHSMTSKMIPSFAKVKKPAGGAGENF